MFYEGPAWHVASNKEEQFKGHVRVLDTSINGVSVVPNGFEGADEEFEYVITWAAWEARPFVHK